MVIGRAKVETMLGLCMSHPCPASWLGNSLRSLIALGGSYHLCEMSDDGLQGKGCADWMRQTILIQHLGLAQHSVEAGCSSVEEGEREGWGGQGGEGWRQGGEVEDFPS